MISYAPERLNVLSFPGFPAPGRHLVIDSARHSAVLRARQEGAGGCVVRVPAGDGPADFATMSRLLALTDALGGLFEDCLPGLHADLTRELATFEASVRRNELGGLLPLTQSATLGVTRRISRESHDSAVVIDRLARMLVSGLTAAGARHGAITLLVDRLDLWDRPSTRVLYRMCRLAADAPFTVLASTRDWRHLSGSASLGPLQLAAVRSRVSWLARLAGLPGVVMAEKSPRPVADEEVPDAAERTAKRWHALAAASFPNALLELGNALAFQNFEQFFLVAETGLATESDPERRADIERLIGIAEAQLGRHDAAVQRLEQARKLTGTPSLAAHLSYLIGLLHTKRNLSPDEGARHHDEGLAMLRTAEDSPRNAVEASWILNGKALVEAMSAREAANAQERRAAVDRAFGLCFTALDGIKGLTGEHADYLRFNLVANITFLLEITERPREAARFWARAFAGIAASGSTAFLVPYHTRLAQLLAQARDPAAADHFGKAIACARARGDRFYEERIRYAQAYAAFQAGDFQAALRHFRTGAHLAARSRDHAGYLQHLRGAVVSLVEWGRTDAAADLYERFVQPAGAPADALRGAVGIEELRRRLAAHGVTVQRPSPKLPPYIACVDLEGVGEETVNNILVTRAGGPS